MLNCTYPTFHCMGSTCPKCGQNVPDDSLYCPHCGHGLKPSAKTTQVSTGGTLAIVAAVAHLVILAESLKALAEIYSWYPAAVAQGWIMYDQLFTAFAFTGFLFGLVAGILSLARRSYTWTMVSTIICMLSGGSVWAISMIIPYAHVWSSFLYYFLPMFVPSLIAVVMISTRKAEFRK